MQDRDEVEVIDYLKILWRWKWLILGGTFLAVVVAFLARSRPPRAYETSVTMLMTRSKIPGYEGASSSSSVNLETLAEIMKSDSWAAEAIKRFRLDDPPYNVTVERFVSDLVRVKPGKETNLITLTVTLPDPKLAADTANFLAQKAVEVMARFDQEDAQQILKHMEQPRDQARQLVEDARMALMDFKRRTNLEGPRIEQKSLSEGKARLAALLAQTTTEQTGLRARVGALTSSLKQQEPILTLNKSIFTDPSLSAAAQEQGTIGMTAQSSLRLNSQEVNSVYQDIRKELINEVASLASLESKQKDIERKAEENERKLIAILQEIGPAESKLEVLTRNYSLAQDAYESLVKKHNEVSRLIPIFSSKLKIVEPAIIPTSTIGGKGGKRKENVVIAGTAALIASIMLAFFLEYLLGTKRRREKIASTAFS